MPHDGSGPSVNVSVRTSLFDKQGYHKSASKRFTKVFKSQSVYNSDSVTKAQHPIYSFASYMPFLSWPSQVPTMLLLLLCTTIKIIYGRRQSSVLKGMMDEITCLFVSIKLAITSSQCLLPQTLFLLPFTALCGNRPESMELSSVAGSHGLLCWSIMNKCYMRHCNINPPLSDKNNKYRCVSISTLTITFTLEKHRLHNLVAPSQYTLHACMIQTASTTHSLIFHFDPGTCVWIINHYITLIIRLYI